MDLKQLQYFVASVDSGSLKKASEMLYTSQPHISKSIKNLETELRVKLLIRRSRGVEVTDAGRKVYEYAHKILTEAGKLQAVHETRAFRTLSVAANSSMRLMELFQDFYVRVLNCSVHAQYTECSTEEIFQHIHRHMAELGFVHVDVRQMTAFEQMLEYRHLKFEEIGKTTSLLFVGSKNPLYEAEYVTGKELKNLQYVQLKEEQDSPGIHLMEGAEDYRHYRSRGQVLVTNSRSMIEQLLCTTSLGSIGCGLVSAPARKDGIRGIPIRGMEENIIFGCIMRKRDGISQEGEKFVSFVKNSWKP